MATQALEAKRLGAPAREYEPDIAEEICEALASSSKGLVEILGQSDRFPCYRTVLKWLNSNADFEQKFAQARRMQADHLAAEIIAISDETEGDAVLKHDRDGNPYAAFDGRNVQRARLMTDNRKWLAGVLNPRRYGDKLDVTTAGQPITTHNSVTIDARVQSIMLLADQRRLALSLLDE